MSWGEGKGAYGFCGCEELGFGGCFGFCSKSLWGTRPDLSLSLSARGVAKVFGVLFLRGGCVVV